MRLFKVGDLIQLTGNNWHWGLSPRHNKVAIIVEIDDSGYKIAPYNIYIQGKGIDNVHFKSGFSVTLLRDNND